MNDEALKRAIRLLREDSRSELAWESFYRLMYPFLFATLYRGVRGHWFLAEEGVQEVMLRALRNLNFKDPNLDPASIFSYLKATARSVMIDMSRRNLIMLERGMVSSETGDVDVTVIPDRAPNPEEDVLFSSAMTDLLNNLNSREQNIVIQLLAGRPVREIAKSLEISEKTAQNYISKLKKRINSFLFSG